MGGKITPEYFEKREKQEKMEEALLGAPRIHGGKLGPKGLEAAEKREAAQKTREAIFGKRKVVVRGGRKLENKTDQQ